MEFDPAWLTSILGLGDRPRLEVRDFAVKVIYQMNPETQRESTICLLTLRVEVQDVPDPVDMVFMLDRQTANTLAVMIVSALAKPIG